MSSVSPSVIISHMFNNDDGDITATVVYSYRCDEFMELTAVCNNSCSGAAGEPSSMLFLISTGLKNSGAAQVSMCNLGS